MTRNIIAGIFGFTLLIGIQSSATAASLTGTVGGRFDFFLPGPEPMIEGRAVYFFDKQTGNGTITFLFDGGARPIYQIEEGRKFPEPDFLVTFKIVQANPMSMGLLQASFPPLSGLGDITNIPGFGGAIVENFMAAHFCPIREGKRLLSFRGYEPFSSSKYFRMYTKTIGMAEAIILNRRT